MNNQNSHQKCTTSEKCEKGRMLLNWMYEWIAHTYSVVSCYPGGPGDSREIIVVVCHESLGVRVTLLV